MVRRSTRSCCRPRPARKMPSTVSNSVASRPRRGSSILHSPAAESSTPRLNGDLPSSEQFAARRVVWWWPMRCSLGWASRRSHFWSFERRGLRPDIVTLGKPVGNGYPMGIVIAGRDLIESFQRKFGFFSTFGGNAFHSAHNRHRRHTLSTYGAPILSAKLNSSLKFPRCRGRGRPSDAGGRLQVRAIGGTALGADVAGVRGQGDVRGLG